MTQDELPVSENKKACDTVGLSTLISESKLSAKPSYHEKLAIGITLVVLILGYTWGMYTVPINFVRSGTLIIVIGIIFAALDLTGRLSLVDEWAVASLEKIRPIIIPVWNKKAQLKASDKIKRREAVEENITNRIKEATDKGRMRLRFIEVSILILGTLIHGFGDLIVVHLKF